MKSREIRDNDRKNYRANLIFRNFADIAKKSRIDKIYTHRQNESYVLKNRFK